MTEIVTNVVISDASIYKKYRYTVSISTYRTVSYRPREYQLLKYVTEAQFLLFRVNILYIPKKSVTTGVKLITVICSVLVFNDLTRMTLRRCYAVLANNY